VLVEEESLLLYNNINLCSTAMPYTHASTPALLPSLLYFLLDQGQRFKEGPDLTISIEQSVGVYTKGQDPFVEV
jgi:hypothetical protein